MWLYADRTARVQAGWKSPPKLYWINQVKCTSKEESLLNCPVDGQVNANCKNFVAVECSGNVMLSLNLNGQRDKCAGVVEFLTPSGNVVVCHSKVDKSIADKICEELGCGKHYYIPKPGMFKGQQSKRNVVLNCVGGETYSWQCMEWSDCQEQASVICMNHKRLRLRGGSSVCSGLVEENSLQNKLWKLKQADKMNPDHICTQLNCGSTGNFTNVNGSNRLTCSDSVKLKNFTRKCFGDVSIDVNGTNYGVCYSDPALSRKMGAVVCRELGCGEVVDVKQNLISNGLAINVECLGDEQSLGHCLRNRETKQCKRTKVVCSESLDVRLSDGLGRCSGRLEVLWEGSWRSVVSDRTPETSDVVCQHLSCGTSYPTTQELFVEGNLQPLERQNIRCKNSTLAKLHECFDNTDSRPSSRNEKTMEIICKKEEVVFFEGNSSCQGRVRIETFDDKKRWLPAKPIEESKKKAGDFCSTMLCGSLDDFDEKQETYAEVKCSGSVSVELQNECWGTVKVCREGKCGGVCSDTWRANEDQMICGNLGCGDSVQAQLTLPSDNLSVSYYSVYCSGEKNMSMCKFIPNKDSVCKTPAQVMCTGSIKAKLQDPRDKCAGIVSLFYAGQWTSVCQDSNNKALQNAICRELKCGESDSLSSTSHDESQILGLSGFKCQNGDNSVSKCDLKGISKRQCAVMYLKCKEWERLLLYKQEAGECSGLVYGLNRGGTPQLVRWQGWGQEEGQKLCENLQCGNYKSHSRQQIQVTTTEWWNKTYNCSGKNVIWDCESHSQPGQLQEQLNIQCDRARPEIKLSNDCYGEVLIEDKNVFASHWHDDMFQELCYKLSCGNAIQNKSIKTDKKECWHFSCTGMETLMWQCASKNDTCEKILSVTCERAVEFSTTEKCGGKLGIKYKGQWKYACGNISDADTKKICGVLKCNESQKLLDEREVAKTIQMSFSCSGKHQNMFDCIKHLKDECRSGPAEIKCDGYIPKQDNFFVSLILGLLGAVLGLVILILMWMKRKRLLLALRQYRNKNGKDFNSDVNEMDKMDTEDGDLPERKASLLDHDKFDRDDYEDVDSLMEKSGEEDEDYRKRGSSGTEYDDIEGQANGISSSETHHDDNIDLPLLPKRPENILDYDTYEVEMEKQEDYDDVEPIEDASNENAGTTGTQARLDVDSDAGPGPGADAMLVTAEVEVHAQPEY
ncbi:antigen WC1.1 [Labeo rohita]|uniref:antigen WC1.1 n=1 Tax=Labeo rohita TaxID=84645 RepID=UPI0021E1ECE2|nr:antigen WC1.1 [Labeo rohita]